MESNEKKLGKDELDEFTRNAVKQSTEKVSQLFDMYGKIFEILQDNFGMSYKMATLGIGNYNQLCSTFDLFFAKYILGVLKVLGLPIAEGRAWLDALLANDPGDKIDWEYLEPIDLSIVTIPELFTFCRDTDAFLAMVMKDSWSMLVISILFLSGIIAISGRIMQTHMDSLTSTMANTIKIFNDNIQDYIVTESILITGKAPQFTVSSATVHRNDDNEVESVTIDKDKNPGY